MINLRIQPSETKANALAPRLAVVGVGGAGGNAVNNMVASGLDGVEFLVCNTDAQALSGSRATRRIQLGANITAGLGAGAKPEIGRAAAEESLDELMTYIDGANMVFITAGMGGGTGTGAAPILAKACKEAGILTVGVVTKPFHFEGTMRMKAAEAGIKEMQQYVDTLIIIPNQNLFRIATEKTTFADAFKLADEVLQSAVRGVTDLMVMPGLVNLDFNDIKTTMTEMGKAMMGTGQSSGDRRAVLAAEAAINNPLLDDVSMKGAKGVIINIAGGADMTLFEVDEACNRIREEVDVDANIIFGTSFDDTLGDALRVTVLATGIETEADRRARTEGGRRYTEARATQTVPAVPQKPVQAQQPVRSYAAVADQPAAVVEPTPAAYVHGQAFIPPVAQETDPYTTETVPYSQIISGVAAPKVTEEQPVYEPEVAPAPVYTQAVAQVAVQPEPTPDLSIPASIVPTMSASHQARRAAAAQPAPSMAQTAYETAMEPALSLFQRITSRVRKSVEASFEDTVADEPVYAPQQYSRGGAQPAVTSQPIPAAAQAPVEVARPAKAAGPQAELDLDIPAFLRRQAS